VIPRPQNYQILPIKKSNMQEPFIPQKKIDEKHRLILDCKFGEFLIFKQSLLHKSGANISNKVRVSLQIRFNRFNKKEKPESTYIAKHTQFVLDNQKKLQKSEKVF
jgi:ectoine hydroxylase-related dioxygenase (phytanoyl-CoA dioxygenase family)